MKAINSVLGQLAARQDLIFLAFIFVFVLMFIVPVPPAVVDILIAMNIALTLVVIVAATYLKGPSDLSTFPAIILFTTVFRLAITVASARLILATADAGDVIKAFGTFVISGKILVGLIVFLIVAIVQFIVVVKGAERIAEVGARFTLDALPGKQMSIDSDLRNGDITKDEARARRSRLEKESQFFGAMDGAMRFVKGDAIAGFVVIFVNLLGGILIGMATRGMGFSEASRTYSLLTVGEGLVSQIPAMLVAIASGIVATRVAHDNSTDLGSDIAKELAANKRSMAIAGGVLTMLGFMPGFPTLIFAAIGCTLVGGAFWFSTGSLFHNAPEETPEDPAASVNAAAEAQAAAASTWRVAEPGDIFQLAAHSSLAETWDASGLGKSMTSRSDEIERDLGFAIARVTLRKDDRLAPDHYRLEIEDVPVFENRWQPETTTLLLSPPEAAKAGLSAQRSDHTLLGSIVSIGKGTALPEIDSSRVLNAGQRLVAEMNAAVRRNASASFGIAEAQGWLDHLKTKYPQLVTQTQQSVPLLRMVEICRRLLDEGVSLSPPRALLEAIIRNNVPNQDVSLTVEEVRKAMRRQIVHAASRGASFVQALLLEPVAETKLTAMSRLSQTDAETARSSSDLSGLTFARAIGDAARDAGAQASPVLVTTSKVRLIAQTILRRHGVQVPVISLEEIGNDLQIQPLRAMTVAELGLA